MAPVTAPGHSGAVTEPAEDPAPEPADPVLVRRAQYQRLAETGQRIGYLLYALAIVAFVVGFLVGFPGYVVTLIIVAMVVGSVVLLPAIITGYAVKAAERDDREQGRL
jgi:hypothetical protein